MSGILVCYVRISAQRYSTTEHPSLNFPDACFEFQSFTKKTHCKDKGGGNIPRHSKQRSLVEKQGNQKNSTKSETPQLLLSGIFTFRTTVYDLSTRRRLVCLLLKLEMIVVVAVCSTNEIRTNKRAIKKTYCYLL
jgi:hypothetical protein